MQPICTLSLSSGVETAADDEFGAAAADVDHQPRAARECGKAVGDAEIDQARFLAAGHDFDRMAERGFGGGRNACGDASRRTVLVATARTRLGGRPRRRWPKRARQSSARSRAFGIQRAVGAQSGGEAHAVAQAVDHARLAVLIARDDHDGSCWSPGRRRRAVRRRGCDVGVGSR